MFQYQSRDAKAVRMQTEDLGGAMCILKLVGHIILLSITGKTF